MIALQNNVAIILRICFTGTCICLPGDKIATVDDCITLVVAFILRTVVVGAIIQTQLMPVAVLAFTTYTIAQTCGKLLFHL